MEDFRELLFECSATDMRKIVDHIERNLRNGWSRDSNKEKYLLDRGSSDMFCFCCDKRDERQAACLWVSHRDRNTWYVSNVVPSQVGKLDYADYNRIVEEFAREYACPIGQQLNVRVTMTEPIKKLSDWLSPDAEQALIHFSHSANRSTGSSHPLDQRRWYKFLAIAHRDRALLDASTLQRWLVEEERWPQDVAFDLCVQYERGRGLLKFFEERSWD